MAEALERIDDIEDKHEYLDNEFREEKETVWEAIHSLMGRVEDLEGQLREKEEAEQPETAFVSIMKVGEGPERQEALINIALATYVGEPCRICGVPITWEDIKGDGVVFAGYSEDNKSRSAHKACWKAHPIARPGGEE